MAKYLIQSYNKEMTVLVEQVEKQYADDVDALGAAYDVAQNADIVILYRRNETTPHYLKKIAKLY